MKKYLAIALSFLMAFSAFTAISPVSVSAANEAETADTPKDAFEGKGGMTVSWESQMYYKGTPEAYEVGTFTGKRK